MSNGLELISDETRQALVSAGTDALAEAFKVGVRVACAKHARMVRDAVAEIRQGFDAYAVLEQLAQAIEKGSE